MNKLIKIILISLLLLNASCYFDMARNNSKDPEADGFIPPEARADFIASVTEGNARLTVEFADQSAGDITVWEWDFDNDGTVDSTEKNPTYTYRFAGTYSVRLKVTESRGLVSDEKIKIEYIDVSIGYPVINEVKNDFDGAISVAAADVDNDGDMDIIGASYWHGQLIWFENTGNGSSLIEHVVAENTFCFWSVIPSDIDKDGDIDFISAGPYSVSQGICWWENLKGQDEAWKDVWISHAVDTAFAGAHYIRAADLDDDGDIDIAGAAYEDAYGSRANSEISWWENMDGSAATWTKHKLTAENTGTDFKGIANISLIDPDADGDLDIAYTERTTGKISLLENKKGEIEDWKESFTEQTIDAAFSTADGIFSADIDGDGDSDLIAVSYGTWSSTLGIYANSYACWWENTKSSSWEKHVVNEDSLDGGRAVIAKDIDGDGDTDIVTAASNSDVVIWWENSDGSGTGWSQHTVNMHFHSAYSLDAADLDNDGDQDIICASMGNWSSANNYYYLSNIAWWEIIY